MNAIISNHMLRGTCSVITGIANSKSIAYSIAQSISDNGGDLIVTYMDAAHKEKISSLVEGMNIRGVFYYNARELASMSALMDQIAQVCPNGVDNALHAMAWADKEQLRGRYCDTTWENFALAMQISCFSFTNLAQGLSSMMNSGGSMTTLSYYGAEKYIANYNVMGVCKAALESSVRYLAVDMGPSNIRVNAISAGPIKTLAATGIKDFNSLININANTTPLKRTVSANDVANMALFLSTKELSESITGQVFYVDAGYSIMGTPPVVAE